MKYAGMPFGMWTLFAPSFILSMPERPDVERLTEYYAKSMMTKPMKWFCRKSGKKQVYPKRYFRHEGDRHLESRRPQPIFVEHGVLRISRRQRLRGTLHQMRYLCADEKAGKEAGR